MQVPLAQLLSLTPLQVLQVPLVPVQLLLARPPQLRSPMLQVPLALHLSQTPPELPELPLVLHLSPTLLEPPVQQAMHRMPRQQLLQHPPLRSPLSPP